MHGQIGNPRYSLENIVKASGVKFMTHELRKAFAAIAESPGSGLRLTAPHGPQDPRGRQRRLSGNHRRVATQFYETDRGLHTESDGTEGRRERGADQEDCVRLANIFGAIYTVTDQVTDR